jgi:hypothetical protein
MIGPTEDDYDELYAMARACLAGDPAAGMLADFAAERGLSWPIGVCKSGARRLRDEGLSRDTQQYRRNHINSSIRHGHEPKNAAYLRVACEEYAAWYEARRDHAERGVS